MSEIITNLVTSVRILKVASCPTSSGKATLTYHIGCTSDNEINFRVASNTGGGFFSPEWVSFSAIQPALEQAPQPLTSYPLIKLYQGKSTNTPAFLMAGIALLIMYGVFNSMENMLQPWLGPLLAGISWPLAIFIAPAVGILAIKAIWDIGKED